MLANRQYADLVQSIGLASLGADDKMIWYECEVSHLCVHLAPAAAVAPSFLQAVISWAGSTPLPRPVECGDPAPTKHLMHLKFKLKF